MLCPPPLKVLILDILKSSVPDKLYSTPKIPSSGFFLVKCLRILKGCTEEEDKVVYFSELF